MDSSTQQPVLKSGSFLYDGQRICKVRIVQTDFSPGSGDYEDEPEFRDDKHGTFFDVQYTSPREERFTGGGPGYASLEAAVAAVEKIVIGVQWDS
jgi:hypothetical protein